LVRFLLAELMIGTVSQRWVSLTARTGFSLLLAELMIGTGAKELDNWQDPNTFQSPISGVNDWNQRRYLYFQHASMPFQSPISGVNDWNGEEALRGRSG